MEHELAGVQQSAEAVGAELRAVQRELNHAKQVRRITTQRLRAGSYMLVYLFGSCAVQL